MTFHLALAVGCGLVVLARPAAAQIELPKPATFIEWDLPSFEGAGMCPSSIGAITLRPLTGGANDPVYYVTRCDAPSANNPLRIGPVVVEFRPGNEGTTIGPQAFWTSWNLGTIPGSTAVGADDFGPTGGVRFTRGGMAFVRGATQLLRLNLVANADGSSTLTRWNDVVANLDPNSVSDVALIERSANGSNYVDVWTTHDAVLDPTKPAGVVQRLTVKNGDLQAKVTRWAVNGGAGREFLSGIVTFQGKVYFSEGGPSTLVLGDDLVTVLGKRGNAIGELDPSTNTVRHFSLDAVGAIGPRQLSVDAAGVLWTVTESGHVVSLRPTNSTAQMAAYLIPGAGLTPGPFSDPRGISPAGGLVGFTESAGKKVGLLIPNDPGVTVTPFVETVIRAETDLTGTPETVHPDRGVAEPITKDSVAVHTDMDPFGEFIEAVLPDTGDFPLGILRDPFSTDAAFWVAVQINGTTEHRISRVVFPTGEVTTSGSVTGGGTIDSTSLASADTLLDSNPDAWALNGGKANFGFVVYRKKEGDPVRGHLNYLNKETGEHVRSIEILTFERTDNVAKFSGSCVNRQNGVDTPCTFDVTVEDNGNPGKGNDKFAITGLLVTPNGSTLNGGNIVIHKPR